MHNTNEHQSNLKLVPVFICIMHYYLTKTNFRPLQTLEVIGSEKTDPPPPSRHFGWELTIENCGLGIKDCAGYFFNAIYLGKRIFVFLFFEFRIELMCALGTATPPLQEQQNFLLPKRLIFLKKTSNFSFHP